MIKGTHIGLSYMYLRSSLDYLISYHWPIFVLLHWNHFYLSLITLFCSQWTFHLFITIIHSFPYLLFHVAGSSLYTQKGSFLLWTSKKGNKELILLLPTMSSLLKKFNINFIKIQINICIYFFFEWNLSWGIIFLKRRLMYSVTALVDSWSTEEPTNHVLRFPWIL